MNATSIEKQIYTEVNTLISFDTIEQAHKEGVLDWIKSGAPLFRIDPHLQRFTKKLARYLA